ncbi:MAG: phage major capsid protein [Chloroflexi bacterium]|nr:phage major capsid protein [Chloroflexota bacterium]
MAMTLTEANKLSNDVLKVGVVEETVKESPVLQMLPFIEIVGNGLTYNRENALANAAFFDVGDSWTESTPTFTQLTASLKILGGDADVDNFLKMTRSNLQDLEATIIALKAKALAHKFEDTFINGDDSSDAKSFDGIDVLTVSGQQVSMGTNGATLTLAKVDELIDKIKPGKPDLLLMSRRSRRKLKSLRQTGGNILETDRNNFGQMVTYYDGIPIGINDWISDTQTKGNTSTNSKIHAVKFGETGVCGLQSPGGVQVERVGSLETKDATRTRVKWYVTIATFSTLSVAYLDGVQD